MNAKKYPATVALKDKDRRFTYPETNQRVNRLAHSLLSLGLTKGDKVAVFMENSIEIVEIFLATAKTGIVIVPINFRLVGREVLISGRLTKGEERFEVCDRENFETLLRMARRAVPRPASRSIESGNHPRPPSADILGRGVWIP